MSPRYLVDIEVKTPVQFAALAGSRLVREVHLLGHKGQIPAIPLRPRVLEEEVEAPVLLPDATPTIDHFERCKWEDVVTSSERKDCKAYLRLFVEKAKEAEEQADTDCQKVFALLFHICSLLLQSSSPNETFGSMAALVGGRSAILDDFNESQLMVLEEIVHDVEDAELRARIADVLWYRRKGGHQMAELAVRSYLESARSLEHPENWSPSWERTERGTRLAASLGKQKKPFVDAVQHMEDVLDKYQGEDPLFLSARLMQLLLDYKQGDPGKYAAIAEKAALRAEASEGPSKWDRARTYWEIKADWHSHDDDEEERRASRIKAAETHVKEAEDALNRPSHQYSVAASFLQQGIEALRRIEGTAERRKTLHKVLLEYQKKSMTELQHISDTMGVTEIAEAARDRVRGKSLREALLTVALSRIPPKVTDLRKRAEDDAQRYVFTHLIPAHLLDEEGKVIARRPGMLGDESQTEEMLKAQMYSKAAWEQRIFAQAEVLPAITQITIEHRVTVADLIPFVSDNPFVPPGREYIFAQGLLSGLIGDGLVAAHLLIPQIENCIRYLLSLRGIPVSVLDDQGIQEERNLNSTLQDPETEKILGKDLVFDLQGLLIERFGSNLRNRIAHGLMSSSEYSSAQVLYL